MQSNCLDKRAGYIKKKEEGRVIGGYVNIVCFEKLGKPCRSKRD
jgi:hypothetical protein